MRHYLSRAISPALFVVGAVVIVLLPRFMGEFRLLQFTLVAIYVIALLGLNILTGYSGQISLGHGAFMAIGGYTTAILVSDHGMKDLWTIPLAGLVAGAAGFVFGLPALRLSGLYLALATFAIAVATPTVIRKFEGLTGGSSGILLFDAPGVTLIPLVPVEFLGREMSSDDALYYLTWGIAVVLFVAAWLLHHSRVGRALRAIRDSEIAAASSGVNLAAYKTLAFALSAFYAGVAGSLVVIASAQATPGTFPVGVSIELLVGLAIGGLGSLAPLVAGAVFLVFMPQWATEVSTSPGVPTVIFGALLIATMFVLPTGVGGLLRRVFQPLTMRLYTRP